GILPRRAGLLPWIWHGLDDDRIRAAIGEAARGPIRRYLLPGLGAMNMVLEQSLGGGGVASLLNDAQGKAYAQRLLALPLEVPAALVPPAPGTEEG
ncbi:MAG: terpene utilization protein AtuA, partial [Alphaproteobacteria bacterium]